MNSILLSSLLLLLSITVRAQSDNSSALYNTLKAKDSLLFTVGFNTCDMRQFEDLLSDHFEFIHDQAGITPSKADFISSIRDGVCNLPYKPRRELDEQSLKVYPLESKDVLYGAVQTGTHRFYAVEKDKSERLTSVAQFTHVWMLDNGQWKLSRALSYDHRDQAVSAAADDDAKLFHDKAATERWLAQKRIPALGMGFIRGGKVETARVFGALEQGRPAPDNTIWNVASLTKPITALVALKLVNAGEWSLDEPVSKWWIDPDIADDPRTSALTTRHILSHQTGFPNWRSKRKDGKLTFEFQPGTKFQYSGEGYEYLRRALESKFHKTLDQLADELVFKPLQMADTHFFWDASTDESRFAKWHDANGNLYPTGKTSSASGADDLLTTVGDYCKFMVHIMDGAGLSSELYDQMIASQVRINDRKHFGLGWWVDENIGGGESALVHGGDDTGVHTIAFILPKSKQGLLIFTNCDNGTAAYEQTLRAYLGTLGQGIIDVETR